MGGGWAFALGTPAAGGVGVLVSGWGNPGSGSAVSGSCSGSTVRVRVADGVGVLSVPPAPSVPPGVDAGPGTAGAEALGGGSSEENRSLPAATAPMIVAMTPMTTSTGCSASFVCPPLKAASSSPAPARPRPPGRRCALSTLTLRGPPGWANAEPAPPPAASVQAEPAVSRDSPTAVRA